MPALTLFIALLFSQLPKAGIEGVVLRTGSNEPIADLRVNLSRPLPPVDVLQSVVTDKNGRFAFSAVPAGEYRVSPDMTGYAAESLITQMLGSVPGTAVTIKDDKPVQALQFYLTPESLISGRVQGTAGEPLADVELQLVMGRYRANGRKTYANYAAVVTNDRGEFRLFGLQPGRYYLRAAAPLITMSTRPDLFAARGSTDDVGTKYTPTFYPNAISVAESSVLEIKPGSTHEKIDITMRERPNMRYRIQGRIVDAGGALPPGAQYTFYRRSNEGQTARRASNPAPDGTFEIPNLDPGSWVIEAFVQAPARRPEPGAPRAGFQTLYAYAMVDVLSGDASGVVLRLNPISLNGRLQMEGQAELPTDLQVRLNKVEPNSPAPAVVRPDGSFAFVNVSAGAEYDLAIVGLLPDMYLKSARIGALDLRYQALRVSDGPQDQIAIEIGTNGSSISGTVQGQSRHSVRGARVALVPDDRARRDLFRFATAETDGRFSIRGVPPGNYKLFAFETADPYEAFDSGFLQPYEASGTVLRVAEPSKLQVDVRVVPASN